MLTSKRKNKTSSLPDNWPSRVNRHVTAGLLDRLADAELQHGHHAAAEQLSRRASEMREAAQ